MRVKPYPQYKTSPISWLDQMPQHWDAASLRWLSRRYAGGTPDKGSDAYWEDGEIPWLNSGAVNDGYITQPSALITRDGFANSSAKWIPKGALVMALAGQGKTKGMVAQLGIQTTCNQSMAAIIPDRRFVPRYLYWWLTANYQNIRNLAGGEARDGLNLDLLGSIPCPLPPASEQEAVVQFLDAESAQIDSLVAKKRDLVDKLREKRNALIARTVTHGLPPEAAQAAGLEPNPKMQDSGVEWLGENPAHWRSTQLKYAASKIVDCPHDTPQYDPSGEYFVVRTADIGAGTLDLSRAYRVDESEYVRRVRRAPVLPSDILYGREGERWGFAALAPEEKTVCLGQRMMQFRAASHFHPRFLMWHLNARCVYEQGAVDAAGSTAPHVNVQTIRNYRLVEPPASEQAAIAAFIDNQTRKTDQLIEQVHGAVERLNEYRQALITSAVTGKIDVRHWQADKEAA